MVFKRLHAERRAERPATQGAEPVSRSETLKKALMEDGLTQLVATIEALHVLEARIQLVEDEMTAGEALTLPELPTAKDVGVVETEPRFMEAALLIGAITRRMNLRLGAVERALDDQEPLVLKPLPVKSPAHAEAMKPKQAVA